MIVSAYDKHGLQKMSGKDDILRCPDSYEVLSERTSGASPKESSPSLSSSKGMVIRREPLPLQQNSAQHNIFRHGRERFQFLPIFLQCIVANTHRSFDNAAENIKGGKFLGW
jgi:hypothetical protein